MTEADWPTVIAIYRAGIATGNATFAPEPPASWDAWYQSKISECSLVARNGNTVVGWAAASPVSNRDVYAGVAEDSIYIAPAAARYGVGSRLLHALITTSEAHGIWLLQGSIFPENTASLRLHARHGFREIGRRERIGLMTYGPWQNQWRDTVLVERRSRVIGV